MRILMVEDNRSYGEYLYENLVKVGETTWLISERDFADNFDLMEAEPPDVAVIDSMLRWDIPRRNEQLENVERDLYTAGIRCALRLLDSPKTKQVPVLLFTVIDEEDLLQKATSLPANVTYIPKASDLSRIIDAVRNAASERIRD